MYISRVIFSLLSHLMKRSTSATEDHQAAQEGVVLGSSQQECWVISPEGNGSQAPQRSRHQPPARFWSSVCFVALHTHVHENLEELDFYFQKWNGKSRATKGIYAKEPLAGHWKLLKVGWRGDKQKRPKGWSESRWPARFLTGEEPAGERQKF